MAYAIILLRCGGYPCIFFPDYYGADYKGVDKDGNTCEHPGGMAVLLSNDADGTKSMNTGSAGITYGDATEHVKETVTTNDEGWAEFKSKGRSVSVWVPVDL